MNSLKFIFIGIGVFFIGIIGVILLTFLTIIGSDDDNDVSEAGAINIGEDGYIISDKVMRYKDKFKKIAKENGIADQVNVLLAITMQESGGSGLDVMQSSESRGDRRNTITDPIESIEVGVSYYADLYKRTDEDLELTLQAYNMGSGFIDYAEEHNNGEYSQELAEDFSDEQKEKNNVRVYGDPYYVENVMRYLDHSNDKKEYKDGKWGPPLERDLDIKSAYGKRNDPFDGGITIHFGIDFACSPPDEVLAVHDGEVYQTGNDVGGWGNHIVIKNSEDELSLVGHLSKIKVNTGDTVQKGDTIGVCGSTGGATGPHVHLEYWDSDKGGSDTEHRKNPNKMLMK